MADTGLKIVIGADISAVTDGMKVASSSVANFGDTAEKAFSGVASKVGVAANSFEHAFDEIAAGNAALAKINASIDAAGDAAQQAGAKFDNLGGRLPLQDFNNFKKSIDQLKRDISSGFKVSVSGGSLIPPVPAAVIDSFNKTKVGANQAGLALSNVGRVAQDLPFGFIGIQNNLNPLLESFQRLKAETGSSKAALSALGSSLIGAGGIGLALSVVSSAFLIFQNGIAGFNKKSKEAKESADELARSIRSIGLIQGEAIAGTEGQISQVNALASAVANSNIPYAQRKRALEELKDINKAYFGDLKLEDAATGALTKTVDEYTKALINNAIQKGFVDEIASVAKAVAKQDDVIAKSRLKLAQAQKAIKDAENFFPTGTRDPETARAKARQNAAQKEKEALEELRSESDKVTQLLTQEALVREQLNRAVIEGTKFKKLDTETAKKESDFLTKQLSLLEKIRDAQKERVGQLFDLKDIDEATDKLAKLEQQVGDLKLQIAVRDAKKANLPAAEIEKLKEAIKQDTQKRLNDAFEKEALLLEFSPKLKISQVIRAELPGDIDSKIAKATGLDKKIPIITLHEARIKILGVKLTEQIEFKEKLLNKLNTDINSVLENIQVNGFASLGEKLGEALAGASFTNVFDSLFNILADGLQQFGKALISYGVALLGFQIAIKSLNPIIAIGAGVAAIAAGAAVKASLPKFADGGIVTGPIIGQVGEMHKPEVIMPLDRLKAMLGQVGGAGGDTRPVLLINNEGLWFSMKRGERSAGRRF